MTDCQRTAWTLGGGMQVKRLCLSSFSQNAMNVRNSRSGSRDHFWMIYYFSFFLLQSQFFRYFIRGNGLGVSHCKKKKFQKGVQLWQAEKPQIVFFCAMRRVSVTKEGGVMGMLFQTGEVKAQFFVLLAVYNVFRRSLSVGHYRLLKKTKKSLLLYFSRRVIVVVVVRTSSK